MENLLETLLSARTGVEKVMGDILRILVIYNGILWKSEMLEDMAKIGVKPLPSEHELSQALLVLREKGVVVLEPRRRSSLVGSRETDIMVRLLNKEMVMKIFWKDHVVKQVMESAMEVFRRLK